MTLCHRLMSREKLNRVGDHPRHATCLISGTPFLSKRNLPSRRSCFIHFSSHPTSFILCPFPLICTETSPLHPQALPRPIMHLLTSALWCHSPSQSSTPWQTTSI